MIGQVQKHLFAALLTFCSCSGSVQQTQSGTTTDTVRQSPRDTAAATAADSADAASDDYAVMYVTVADTGRDYWLLRREMADISTQLKYPIDTMDRYYNAQKNEIVVSDTDEDEMYRGEYFPRRFTSNNLSLEYLDVYSKATTQKNIALVAGIYEAQKSADSFLSIIRPYAAHPFVVKANVYVGCMH